MAKKSNQAAGSDSSFEDDDSIINDEPDQDDDFPSEDSRHDEQDENLSYDDERTTKKISEKLRKKIEAFFEEEKHKKHRHRHKHRAEKTEEATEYATNVKEGVETIAETTHLAHGMGGAGEAAQGMQLEMSGIGGQAGVAATGAIAGAGMAEGVLNIINATTILQQRDYNYQQQHNDATAAALYFSGAQSIALSAVSAYAIANPAWVASAHLALASGASAATVFAAPAAACAQAVDLAITSRKLYYAQKECKFEGWLEERVKEWNFILKQAEKANQKLDEGTPSTSLLSKIKYYEIQRSALLNDIQARCWANQKQSAAVIEKQVKKMDKLDEVKLKDFHHHENEYQNFKKFKQVFRDGKALSISKNEKEEFNQSLARYKKQDMAIQHQIADKRDGLAFDTVAKATTFVGLALIAISPAFPPLAILGVAITGAALIGRFVKYMSTEENRERVGNIFGKGFRKVFGKETIDDKLEAVLAKLEKPANTLDALSTQPHLNVARIDAAKSELLEKVTTAIKKITGDMKQSQLGSHAIKAVYVRILAKYPGEVDEKVMREAVRKAYQDPNREQCTERLKILHDVIEDHNAKEKDYQLHPDKRRHHHETAKIDTKHAKFLAIKEKYDDQCEDKMRRNTIGEVLEVALKDKKWHSLGSGHVLENLRKHISHCKTDENFVEEVKNILTTENIPFDTLHKDTKEALTFIYHDVLKGSGNLSSALKQENQEEHPHPE